MKLCKFCQSEFEGKNDYCQPYCEAMDYTLQVRSKQ